MINIIINLLLSILPTVVDRTLKTKQTKNPSFNVIYAPVIAV